MKTTAIKQLLLLALYSLLAIADQLFVVEPCKSAMVVGDISTRADAEDDYSHAKSSLKRGAYLVALDSVNRALIAFPNDKKYVDLKTSILENARTNGVKLLDRIATSYDDEPQTSPNHTPGTLKTVTIAGIETRFRWCPSGEFIMGSPRDEADRNKNEIQHKVIISRGFWLAETETTNALWKAVMGGEDADALPVNGISWHDCQVFIEKIQEYAPQGMVFKLPSEAHWEYACRAGTTTRFFWGNEWDDNRANCITWAIPKMKPVGSYRANNWGLKDMHGNVWEWCEDWYGDYPEGVATDPVGPDNGWRHVIRGGSTGRFIKECRSAFRGAALTYTQSGIFGFRLELTDVSE